MVSPDVLAARRARTYSLILDGLVLDDPAEWRALIEPRLRYLEGYDPDRPGAAKTTRIGAAGYGSADSAGAGPPE